MGDLKLYNTRTRALETFVPLQPGSVRIYVCGLTPSAQAHLGHARSFLFFDLLRRYLVYRGYAVTYVQNVTDIDDRSINRARETGENWYDIVTGYYTEFKGAMRALGVMEPDAEPYATKFIPQIQAMIGALIERGFAYVVEDGIYYRVSAFANYGKLSNRNIEELEAGARIEVGEHKEDPLDFALWKFAKPGEPKWAFPPFGDGRPGWHIECSAMSQELLDPAGVGFDIHGGGADLIFPHHENEIAQSEPLMTHPPMANVWLHGGLLNFEGRKMSKSLGNFEPLVDLLARHDPQAIRLTFLTTGYSKVMNFTEESLSAAYATLDKLKRAYRRIHSGGAVVPAHNVATGLPARVADLLDDDMNTSAALAEVLAFAKEATPPSLREYETALWLLGIEPNDAWLKEDVSPVPADLPQRLHDELGTEISFNGITPEEAIEAVIARRAQARAEKDWAASDRLRDALAKCGITIKDSKEGTSWTVAAG
ncbi:MAG TPA: cysteine--tRNA ligase [Candidatus Aquilonibacter sp.]|nr:cysteine--tRNA ligase [Candidatus Aquilonibacter sp.]